MNCAATEAGPPIRIAYLAPEIPALSATFVYEEALGLEDRGVTILPFGVRYPTCLASGQQDLASRTRVIYDVPLFRLILLGLTCAPRLGRGVGKALGWLVQDMMAVRPWRVNAWKLAFQWMAAARLACWLRESGCVHLHVHFAHVPTQIAMYASALSGVPFTIMAHANDIFERGLLLPRKAARSIKMLTISEYNLAYLRGIGVAESQLAVVRCGVSLAVRDPVVAARRERYRVGTLGRLVEKKGVADLLRAMASLQGESWQWELSVAGDGPLRPGLEALAVELGIAERVRFEGALGHEAVARWLQSLDVFALACKADARGDMDGIPVVLMEAMSQRVPVVSTRLSGIPELVIHERTGLLAEPAQPDSLALQLRHMLDSPLLRQKFSEAAVAHVQAEFGQDVNLDRLMRHFPAAVVAMRRNAAAAEGHSA